jgi:hypothetical protein
VLVEIRDYHGICDRFEVIETGKAPTGYGHKVCVVFINSSGDKEKAVVNPNHIQVGKKKKVVT